MSFNIGLQDSQIQVSQALPSSGNNITTGVIDMQAIAPRSRAWGDGLFAVTIPAIPENTSSTGITIALQAAPPSLTGGSSAIAPLQPGPGTFITPTCAQTITIPAVTGTGSAASVAYFTLALDANGSAYQFYQFLITNPGVTTSGEVLTIAWENA